MIPLKHNMQKKKIQMRRPKNHVLHLIKRRHQNMRLRKSSHVHRQILYVFKRIINTKKKIWISWKKKTSKMIQISKWTRGIKTILKYGSRQSVICNHTLFFNNSWSHLNQNIWSLKFRYMSKHIFQAYTLIYLSSWCALGFIGSIPTLDFVFSSRVG